MAEDKLLCGWVVEGGFIENVTFGQRFEGNERIIGVDIMGGQRLQQREPVCKNRN